MNIREIKHKETWEDFLLGCDEKTFLDAWNWGEFKEAMGDKIWRLGIFENDVLDSVALVVKTAARRGTFLFVPHGPITKHQVSSSKHQVLEVLLRELKKIAKKERANFIRIGPIWKRNEENIKIFKKLGFREAPIHIHPEITWELDIRPSEENLLMQMRKTTRYLIKQALKNEDIKIYQSQNLQDIEIFNKLYQEVVARHHFVPFSLDYLRNEFSSFDSDNQISIFLGKYKQEIVSSAIIIFWQNIAFYHHGASSLKYPKIPISYLLQWEAIKEAKRRECKLYNFWGIVPGIEDKAQISKSKHPWAGLTLFKIGFGGYRKEYLKTQDLPLSSSYWLTCLFEKLRKIKRNL